ncbi:amidohydrolase family protein [Nonomuraea thailandensis]
MNAILDRLRRPVPGRRILLTGAAVVTMDPELGVLPRADLLIEGDRIAAVGVDLQAGDALVIDVTGAVLSPGFVDTHRHAWEAQLRRIMPDVNDLGEYVTSTLAGIAPAYQPQDMYVGTRLAALTAIDSGITTMLDFSHNSRTAAHSDAAIRALAHTGIRGVHASMRPHFGDWDGQWPADLTRLHDTHFTGNPLLTLRLAALATDEVAAPTSPTATTSPAPPATSASASASTPSSACPPPRPSSAGPSRACSARTSPSSTAPA